MVRATCCPRSPATAIAHRGHPTAIAHSQEIAERLGGLLYPDIQRTNPQEAQIFFDWKDKRFILKSLDKNLINIEINIIIMVYFWGYYLLACFLRALISVKEKKYTKLSLILNNTF